MGRQDEREVMNETVKSIVLNGLLRMWEKFDWLTWDYYRYDMSRDARLRMAERLEEIEAAERAVVDGGMCTGEEIRHSWDRFTEQSAHGGSYRRQFNF